MSVLMTQPTYCAEDWEVNINLHPDVRAPRLCRLTTVTAVLTYGLPYFADAAGLVASELVTNAVCHGRPPLAFRVAWYAVRGRLRITVWDEGDGRVPVRPVVVGEGDEGGRGLAIVAAVSADWGQYGTPGDGKAVWAELKPAVP